MTTPTLIAGETIAKSAGFLYLAPLGTGKPTTADIIDAATLAAAGWVHVGWLHEDGPAFTGFDGTTTKHYGWNAVAPIRAITRVTEPQVEVSLLQWNVENLQLYFPGATYDAGSRTLTVPESGNPEEQELLLVVIDGDDYMALWIGKTTHRGGGSFTFPGDGLAPIPLVFDCLSTGDPADFMGFIGIDPEGQEAS